MPFDALNGSTEKLLHVQTAPVLTAAKKTILFVAMILYVMVCQRSAKLVALRAAHADLAQHFGKDQLCADALITCRAGTTKNQAAMSALYAYRTSVYLEHAKRSGWKPGTGSALQEVGRQSSNCPATPITP